MAELHEALKWLSPITWSDVPEEDLTSFTTEAAEAGELICNSVPPPANGTPFHTSNPTIREPNTAKSAKDVQSSESRAFPPHEEHKQLQKAWGKPYKMNAKDNPLNVAVYKMAGKDRHGAWFARYSVHEGIGFDKFKKALQREFSQSLSVSGGPGAGAVRGLAADRRVERKSVDGARHIEVVQLSAQFPGPTTAREFNTLLITSDDALSHKSAAEAEGEKHVPRHYMVISKPVTHPDAPDRSGYVRGQYESVEMIREIPLHKLKNISQSTPNLLEHQKNGTSDQTHDSTTGTPHSSTAALGKENGDKHDALGTSKDRHDPEINPVEWIMVTRSDPGGGIPRFLVDRGTPEAMLADLTKFLDWACAMDEVPDPDTNVNPEEKAPDADPPRDNGKVETTANQPLTAKVDQSSNGDPPKGVLSSLGQAIQHSIDAYAPAVVSRNINHYVHFEQPEDESSESSDDSSVVSFLSAEENNPDFPAASTPSLLRHKSTPSDSSLALRSNIDPKDLNHHDKEANKAAKDRQKISDKLTKKLEEEEDRYQKAISKDPEPSETDKTKALERRDREIKKLEERHAHAVEKLRAKEEKERAKADERRRKKDDANKVSLVSRERDDFRTRAELSRRENGLLMAQVEQLQHENTLLTQELGRLGGDEALMKIRERLATRSRASSVKSAASRSSTPAV